MSCRPTIAQLREREVHRLAGFKSANPTDADIEEARRLMNSFYRLCGLCERNLYLANNERTCNSRSTQLSEEREDRWWKRLDKEFHRLYGLNLVYCGYAPSIVTVLERGSVQEKINRYFYG